MEETSSGVVRVATLNLWGRNGAWDERRSSPTACASSNRTSSPSRRLW
jgi:hypothetical protein